MMTIRMWEIKRTFTYVFAIYNIKWDLHCQRCPITEQMSLSGALTPCSTWKGRTKEVCIRQKNKQANHKSHWYASCLARLPLMCWSVLEENQCFYIANMFFLHIEWKLLDFCNNKTENFVSQQRVSKIYKNWKALPSMMAALDCMTLVVDRWAVISTS